MGWIFGLTLWALGMPAHGTLLNNEVKRQQGKPMLTYILMLVWPFTAAVIVVWMFIDYLRGEKPY